MNEHDEAERLREEAEVEREAHEIRRRIAEGGPDQHVPEEYGPSPPGRFEAEQDRIKAEVVRQATVRHLYARVGVLLALPVALIALIPSLVGLFILWDYAKDNRALIKRLDDQAANAANAHLALCAFKSNLASRAETTAEYMDDIRAGRREPIMGITLGDLQRSLDGQLATLDALKVLDCKEGG